MILQVKSFQLSQEKKTSFVWLVTCQNSIMVLPKDLVFDLNVFFKIRSEKRRLDVSNVSSSSGLNKST